MTKKTQHKRRRIGMLEVTIALGIILFLLTCTWRYYESTHRGQVVQQAMSQITALAVAAKQARDNAGGYKGLSFARLQAQGLLPSEWKDGATASPWGTRIYFSHKTQTSFTIELEGLSKRDCEALKQKVQRNPQAKLAVDACPEFSVAFADPK